MDFKTYLKTTADLIDQELEIEFEKWLKQGQAVNQKIVHLIEASNVASRDGKRLRGVMTKLGYELAGDHENEDILKAAAAYEIFQTAILAHDDIIDLSPTRRGKPTLYRSLGGDHYAISQTISLGDVGFFQALNILATSNFPETLKNKAIENFTETMIDTVLGQLLDVEIPHIGTKRTEEDSLAISHLKTARYTFVGPLQLGAILGGADSELLKNLKAFGDNLGTAFQIQDDILGVFALEAELGKSVTSDIEEGKNTLLITYATDHATSDQVKYLEENYGRGPIDEETHQKIKQIFESCGALEYSKKKALEYVDTAKNYIPEIAKEKNMQNLLEEMSDFLIERSK